ncbi:hypothetical protein XENOCAPTIV_027531 [Xenoophorus captivus]|uniref:Uncharacterized protein n=1 Tax=Xenoophorus captivus TaxID=1517983 RepID=A0ABV0RCK2_9TELE
MPELTGTSPCGQPRSLMPGSSPLFCLYGSALVLMPTQRTRLLPLLSPSFMLTRMQVLEQWESQQGQNSPAQTSRSAPVISHSAPFPTHHLHRASVPASEALALAKPDPYDLFEKSMAIYESRRKYRCSYSR